MGSRAARVLGLPHRSPQPRRETRSSQLMPSTADASEPKITAVLATFSRCGTSPKHSSAMKMDMVNPMPPSSPAPKT